jgi:hypothetical protein
VAAHAEEIDLLVSKIEPAWTFLADRLHRHGGSGEYEERRQTLLDRTQPTQQEGVEGNPVEQKLTVYAGLDDGMRVERRHDVAAIRVGRGSLQPRFERLAQDRSRTPADLRSGSGYRAEKVAGVFGRRSIPVRDDVLRDLRADRPHGGEQLLRQLVVGSGSHGKSLQFRFAPGA